MKIAIIHDWLVTMRGGEKVLEALCEAYPSADLYTIYCDKNQISQKIRNMNIIPSFIQSLPFANRNFRLYLPLFPLAVEKFNLKSYDLIISISHCVAKGVIPANGAFHVCYCNAPMRYVWDFQDEYLGKLKSNFFTGKLIRALIKYLKNWDLRSSPRVHAFIANSRNIAGKIKKYYQRDAAVIYPFVDTDYFNSSEESNHGDYFLIVSSLVPYKRVDMAIEAFNKIGYKLKIVGDGPLRNSLEKKASSNIEFLGWVDQDSLKNLYQDCSAFIFNQDEDFGISALEAQACGKPVIAYAKGGALETVIDKVTGVFFKEQNPDSLISALQEFKSLKFNSAVIRDNALKFNNKDLFKRSITKFISEAQEKFTSKVKCL